MTNKCFIVLISLALACFFLCTSKSPTAPAPSNTTVDQLEISDSAIAGWTVSSASGDTFCSYPIDSFYSGPPGSRDGGAIPYDSAGCKNIAFQTMTGPNSMVCRSYAMDFATLAKASGMFGQKKSSQSPIVAVPGFDISTAFAMPLINGAMIYAHFNKFYIEITLLGSADSAAVLTSAGEFLGVFKEKIK